MSAVFLGMFEDIPQQQQQNACIYVSLCRYLWEAFFCFLPLETHTSSFRLLSSVILYSYRDIPKILERAFPSLTFVLQLSQHSSSETVDKSLLPPPPSGNTLCCVNYGVNTSKRGWRLNRTAYLSVCRSFLLQCGGAKDSGVNERK